MTEAQQLIPTVHERTSDTVARVGRLPLAVDKLPEGDPRRKGMLAGLDEVVAAWAHEMNALGDVVKGPWLVDFDNGYGYYCWQFQEKAIEHYA